MKLVIEIDMDSMPSGLAKLSHDAIQQKFRYLFADAVGEFVTHRANGNANVYVNQRYPLPEYAYLDRAAKIQDTAIRISMAHHLHNSILDLKLVESCNHQFEEQSGEPPIDICISCGVVRK